MCFVQTPEMLRLIAGEQPRGNSMNRGCVGKENSCVDIWFMKIWALPFRYGKPQDYEPDNVKTSPKRQVKAFEENAKGSIESGKLADFAVLSQDIMKILEPEILNTHSVMTVIGGEVMFEATIKSI